MARVIALTDPDTALGFELAGIEVVTAQDGEAARRFLAEMIDRKSPGVVLFNETFLSAVAEDLQKRLEDSLRPVFVPIPHAESWREGEKKEEYLARLLRRVIGYQIKIKR